MNLLLRTLLHSGKLLPVWFCLTSGAAERYDVVVYGATPGGIAAALTSARLGHSVALLEYQRHIGGMSSSGLGRSDVDTREAIGGLFREFAGTVYRHYVDTYGANHENVRLSRDGYAFEPSVAERIFDQMVGADSRIKVFKNQRLEEVVRRGSGVTAIRVTDRASGAGMEIRGSVFVDGTYEGDLAAYAGAQYRVGRESRAQFNELHAGVVFQDWRTRAFLAGTTGAGDRGVQAYTYRPNLTDDPANGVPISKPPGYDRNTYLPYLDDMKSGRLESTRAIAPIARAVTISPVPNHKFDVNMRAVALAYPFVGVNHEYPEADWKKREEIATHIRNLTLGLFYFMQNDPALPEGQRNFMRRYYLPKDEFQDNGNFPWQLYVREARRIVGEYTLNENDLTPAPDTARPPVFADAICAGEYPFDSMPVQKRADETRTILDGYLLRMVNITRPFQIPMRILVPKDLEGVLVPVAASATHVAFSSIRLEPTWMALGQAAGAAAHLAIRDRRRIRDLRPERIQRLLLEHGQVLTYFRDLDAQDPAHTAMQFLGTKGFFTDYQARSSEAVTRGLAARWIGLVLKTAGRSVTAGAKPAVRWADLAPGSSYYADAINLSVAGFVEHPRREVRFDPDRPLDRLDFQTWMCRAGRLLDVWADNANCAVPGAVLEANGLEPSRWVDPRGGDTVRRGEFCRAAFLLLEEAGY